MIGYWNKNKHEPFCYWIKIMFALLSLPIIIVTIILATIHIVEAQEVASITAEFDLREGQTGNISVVVDTPLSISGYIVDITTSQDIVSIDMPVPQLVIVEIGINQREASIALVDIFRTWDDRLMFTVNYGVLSRGNITLDVVVKTLDDDVQGDAIQNVVSIQPMAITPVYANSIYQDNNGDGLVEDLNGNNRFDFNDVVLLFQDLEILKLSIHPEDYDFDSNNILNLNDVINMFHILIGENINGI